MDLIGNKKQLTKIFFKRETQVSTITIIDYFYAQSSLTESGIKYQKWRSQMKNRSKTTIVSLVFLIGLLSTFAVGFSSQEADALKGQKSFKGVFDLRTGNAKMTSVFLKMIHDTYKSKEVESVTKEPEFVVVILGPTVKLVSTNREGVSPEDSKMLDTIAGQISEMTKDGIRVEICLFAARLMNVDPMTILSDIKKVDNGAISLIGYQAQGFSLVPIY